MKILGAGIAGLIAGHVFQNARIYEAGSEGHVNHKALLRFRSNAVGDAVGIDFKKVRVHKGIWIDGGFEQPNIMLANLYSQKVVGKILDRSIWKLDSVDRFIAPEDFIEQLIDRCGKRIEWNSPMADEALRQNKTPTISTIPMSVVATAFYGEFESATDKPEFKFAPIVVKRWRVQDCDVNQTIYYPAPETPLYRASITGDLLIAEFASEPTTGCIIDMFNSFGIQTTVCVEPIETVSQRFGKIAPVDDAWRKKFIYDLSTNHNIYSLGRFGTWRNLLLDDVLHDCSVIKRLINSTTYDRKKINAK
jgi:hypothetical protein